MPLTKCSKNGVSGWKWGQKGSCYTGPGAKAKAIKQAYAEIGGDSQKLKEEMSKAGFENDEDVKAFLESVEPQGSDRYLSAVASHIEESTKSDEWAYSYVSQDERKKMPLSDFGWPSQRKFPIKDQKHLDAAVKLIGRAPPAMQVSIKKRIKEIAKRKGLTLPASWGDSK